MTVFDQSWVHLEVCQCTLCLGPSLGDTLHDTFQCSACGKLNASDAVIYICLPSSFGVLKP